MSARSWCLLLTEIADVALPWERTETGLPSLPVLRSKLNSTDHSVRNQRRFRNIVGGVLSPLLANLYMRRFVLGWKGQKATRTLPARIVNYADDFVICCRSRADEAMTRMRSMMERLKLTVNERKTRLCRLPEETFDFLGYTFGQNYSPRTGGAYIGPKPSGKKISSLCEEISELTRRTSTGLSVTEQVHRLNRKLRGWSNYFRLGTLSRSYRKIDLHVQTRLRRWLCARPGVKGAGREATRTSSSMASWA